MNYNDTTVPPQLNGSTITEATVSKARLILKKKKVKNCPIITQGFVLRCSAFPATMRIKRILLDLIGVQIKVKNNPVFNF